MAYEYILLDWDGTLARTLDIWLDVYKEMCGKYEADISGLSDLEIVEKSFGLWAKGLANLGIKDFDKAYEEALKIVNEKVKTVKLYPNAEGVLAKLTQKGKILALHTSSFRNLLEPAIDGLGLRKYFELILTKNDVKEGKPNPEVILKELDLFHISSKEAIVIGDSDHDIKAGKAAGVKTVLYYPKINEKFYRKEFLLRENSDYVIENLLEIPEVVN